MSPLLFVYILTEIPEKYKWDLSDIFATPADWEARFVEMSTKYQDLAAYQGKLGNKASLLEFMKLSDAYDLHLSQLYCYAFMSYNEDAQDPERQGRFMRMHSLLTQYSASTAFVSPELSAQPDEYLEDCIADPDFSDYDVQLQNLLDGKAHILSAAEETLMARVGAFSGQFQEVFNRLDSGDIKFGSIMVDGKEVVLNIKGKEEFDLPWGGKLEYYNCIVGGAIDARFMPAILKGINEKMSEGPLTGSLARDIRVYVYDGKMHPVDSNEISFVLAARNAFKEAFRVAGPKIMEPIYNVEVLTPSEYMGACMSDLQNRRALIEGMGSEKGFEVIKARVPLAELYRYSTTLSSLSSGSATFTMDFADYQPVPGDVQEKLLKAYLEEEKED